MRLGHVGVPPQKKKRTRKGAQVRFWAMSARNGKELGAKRVTLESEMDMNRPQDYPKPVQHMGSKLKWFYCVAGVIFIDFSEPGL